MKIIVDIEEMAGGRMQVKIERPPTKVTAREMRYGTALKDLLEMAVPKLVEKFGDGDVSTARPPASLTCLYNKGKNQEWFTACGGRFTDLVDLPELIAKPELQVRCQNCNRLIELMKPAEPAAGNQAEKLKN